MLTMTLVVLEYLFKRVQCPIENQETDLMNVYDVYGCNVKLADFLCDYIFYGDGSTLEKATDYSCPRFKS